MLVAVKLKGGVISKFPTTWEGVFWVDVCVKMESLKEEVLFAKACSPQLSIITSLLKLPRNVIESAA